MFTGDRHRQARLRSEEHTSELQSRGHLVCRLVLHSFPTRRSSDLVRKRLAARAVCTRTYAPVGPVKAALANSPWTTRGASANASGYKNCDATVTPPRQCSPATGTVKRASDRKSTRLNSSHVAISYAAWSYTLSLHDALPISCGNGSRRERSARARMRRWDR